jgi:cyclopropane-fatty-acyl-phospholipid synthase
MDRVDTTRAVQLLSRVFAGLTVPLVFRLWDGTAAHVGAPGECDFTVVFRSREVFGRLMRHPTSLAFGEAFIEGDIDIEGDLFAAMEVASRIEGLHVPLGTRIAVVAETLRT